MTTKENATMIGTPATADDADKLFDANGDITPRGEEVAAYYEHHDAVTGDVIKSDVPFDCECEKCAPQPGEETDPLDPWKDLDTEQIAEIQEAIKNLEGTRGPNFMGVMVPPTMKDELWQQPNGAVDPSQFILVHSESLQWLLEQADENTGLRKGIRTVSKKRRTEQVKHRRTLRRLSQARARRDQHAAYIGKLEYFVLDVTDGGDDTLRGIERS